MSEEKKSKEAFMVAVTAMNKFLKQNQKEEIILEGNQANQLQALLAPIVVEIETGNAENLPEEVIEYYNENFAEEEPEDTPPEEPGKETKPKKEKKAKKEKKPRKSAVERDHYGVTVTSGAHKLNLMLEKGASVKDMIDEVGTTRSRVQSHMSFLKTKGFFIENIDGIFTITDTEPAPKPKKEKKEKPAKKEKSAKKEKPAKKEKSAKKEKPTTKPDEKPAAKDEGK